MAYFPIPCSQLELCVNPKSLDSTQRIVVYCEFSRISTLATTTLRGMDFQRAVALDGGMKAWQEASYPITSGPGK